MRLRVLSLALIGVVAILGDGGTLRLEAPDGPASSHPPITIRPPGQRTRLPGPGSDRRALTALARAYIAVPSDISLASRLIEAARRTGRSDWLRSFVGAVHRRLPAGSTEFIIAELKYASHGYSGGLMNGRKAYRMVPNNPDVAVSYAAALAGTGQILEAFQVAAPWAERMDSWPAMSELTLQRLVAIVAVVAPDGLGDSVMNSWLRRTWLSQDVSARARAVAFAATLAEQAGRTRSAAALSRAAVELATRTAVPESGAVVVMTSADVARPTDELVKRFQSVCGLLPSESEVARDDCFVSAMERAVATGRFDEALDIYSFVRDPAEGNPVLTMRTGAVALPLLEMVGAHREAVRVAQRSADAAAAVHDAELQSAFLTRVARARRFVGDYPGAHALAVQAEKAAVEPSVLHDRARFEEDTARSALYGDAPSNAAGSYSADSEPVAGRDDDSPYSVLAWVRHAQQLEAAGQEMGALAKYERGITGVTAMRVRASTDLLQSATFADVWKGVSRRALSIAFRNGDLRRGLDILEAERSPIAYTAAPSQPIGMLPLPDRTVVVAYALADAEVWATVLQGSEEMLIRLPVGPGLLRDRVELWRELAKSDTGGDYWLSLGDLLADALLDPIEKSGVLADAETVYFVPDDVLHLLPIATLASRWSGPGRRNLIFAQAPSLEALRQAWSSVAANGPTVAFGVGGSDTMAEMRAIRELGGMLFIGSRATETEWRRQSRSASVIHFGGHSTPVHSAAGAALRLRGGSDNDGDLTVGEILSTKLPGSVVVLLGCDTAARSTEPTSAAYFRQSPSIGEAFLHAGARAVVGNLWAITEEDARSLAQEFYRVGGPVAGPRALEEARAMLRQRFPDQPRRWAGAVWLGDARGATTDQPVANSPDRSP